jgi:hypothetical protein
LKKILLIGHGCDRQTNNRLPAKEDDRWYVMRACSVNWLPFSTVSGFMSWFTDIAPNATQKGSAPGINLWPWSWTAFATQNGNLAMKTLKTRFYLVDITEAEY